MLRAAGKAFRGLTDSLFTLVFPDDCRVCGLPLQTLSRIPVCEGCLREPQALHAEFYCATCRTPFVNPHPLDEAGRCAMCRLGLSGYDAVYSYGSYEGTLRTLIHLFKFEKVRPLSRVLGRFLARVLPREQRFDIIVPMPLHWRRRWQRGFNQSGLLAKEIGRRWNVPVRNVMRRVKATAPQSGLTNAQRRANVAGAFALNAGVFFRARRRAALKARIKGARVLLVDDVLTTGASASACARMLKRAGASHVALLAVARTDRRLSAPDFETPGAAAASVAAAASAGSLPGAGRQTGFFDSAGLSAGTHIDSAGLSAEAGSES